MEKQVTITITESPYWQQIYGYKIAVLVGYLSNPLFWINAYLVFAGTLALVVAILGIMAYS